jgi:acyl-CoA thioesterase I
MPRQTPPLHAVLARSRAGRAAGTVMLAALVALSGCRGRVDTSRSPHETAAAPATVAADAGARPRIVALGDSLTAGLGLPADEAYPALIQQRIAQEGYRADVINAGVSGDTSAGGLRRLDWALDGDVRILIVALGANDGLRGLPPADMKANLAQILARAQQRGIAVLLAGMEAPPNLGSAYTQAFRQVYRDLAAQYQVPLLPFLLQDVAGVPALNQGDGIHPNSTGARIVADHVWPLLTPLLEKRMTR